MNPTQKLIEAAEAVCDRWDSPLWKDAKPTADYIATLREAVRGLREAGEPAGWLRAIDEAMTTHHIGVAEASDDYVAAKRKLNSLLCSAQDIGAHFERERICDAIKAADTRAVEEAGYMLDSNDCIEVVRGTWKPHEQVPLKPPANDAKSAAPPSPAPQPDTVPVPTVVAWSGGAAPYRFVRLRLDDTPTEYEYVPAPQHSATIEDLRSEITALHATEENLRAGLV